MTSAVRRIDERDGRPDVLVTNAAVRDRVLGADDITGAGALERFDTNAVGVVRVTQAALPLLARSDNPVLVNVSSGLHGDLTADSPTLGAEVVARLALSQ